MKELKDLLKPPFFLDRGSGCFYLRDRDGFILSELPIRHRSISLFLCGAATEKWERDFGEPMRWILMNPGEYSPCYKCEKCGSTYHKDLTNYCPSCGQKLLPPEDK